MSFRLFQIKVFALRILFSFPRFLFIPQFSWLGHDRIFSQNEIFRPMLIVGRAELILDICREKFRALFPLDFYSVSTWPNLTRAVTHERSNPPSTISRIRRETCGYYVNRWEEVGKTQTKFAVRNCLVIMAKWKGRYQFVCTNIIEAKLIDFK